MKLKGKIIQIIKEDKIKIYGLIRAKGYDYLNIRPIAEYEKTFLKVIRYTPRNKRFKGYWFFDYPYKVKKPHNFKVGDKIDITINIKKVRKNG